MKKNVSLISLDSTFALWLYDRLMEEASESCCANDLLIGIEELIAGETATLMLGISDRGFSAPNILDDGIIIGKLSIYPKSRKVVRDGTEVNLTPKEFDILYFLAKNRGVVFTKEQIYKAIWEEDFLLADSNIMAFIRKLRKKIEPNPDSPEYILTIWGIGYKFNDKL